VTRPEHKRPGKRKRVSAVLLAWRAERLLGLLIAGQRLHPEGQPRELFADNPQLVLRAGFVRWPCCARAGARSSRCSAARRPHGRSRRGRSNPAEWVLIPPTCSGARGGARQSVQCYNCGVHVERRDIGCACQGLQVQILKATSSREIDAAFAALVRELCQPALGKPAALR